MTATAIELQDFVEGLRLAVPYVHPAGQATIHEWFVEMEAASEICDAATVAMLARRVKEKVDLELQWQREDCEAFSRANPVKPV